MERKSMKNNSFIIGDVHGCFDELQILLQSWNVSEESLVFLGDLVDRGPKIKETLEFARQLQIEMDAIILKGNHEAMLEEVLHTPNVYWPRYERNGGLTTLAALSGRNIDQLALLTYQERTELFIHTCPWLKEWLGGLPLYVEYGDWIFVHAGVDLTLANWKDTAVEEFVWIRQAFHEGENTTGKRIVFGHTPTFNLNVNQDAVNIWEQDGKYGIDGGAVYGGALLGMKVETVSPEHCVFRVPSNFSTKEKE